VAFLAYKFRLYPTAEQVRLLDSQLETLRQVFNNALAYSKDYYAEHKKSLKRGDLYKVFANLRNLQLTDKKAEGKGPHWLTNVSAVSVRDTCARVETAFDNFFRRLKQGSGKAGFPRFKSYRGLRSIPFENTYPAGCVVRFASTGEMAGETIKNKSGRGCKNVPLGKKGLLLDVFGAGRIKVLAHRPVAGTIKTACVERDVDDRWYVVLVASHDVLKAPESTLPPVGIDVGLEHFVTTSDAEHFANPKHFRGAMAKLRRTQRSVSRKMEQAKRYKIKFRQCKNLQKRVRRAARLHVRVRNLRKESHHQVANSLVRRYGTVCVESLNVRGMVKNGKLSRAISDAGWSGFIDLLTRKAENAGAKVVKVVASGTSQTCPQCGLVAKKKLSQRRHKCPCGLNVHRDHAAAMVILSRGVPGPAGRVGLLGFKDSNPVGMPRERSRGGRGGQRKLSGESLLPQTGKVDRSRTGAGSQGITGEKRKAVAKGNAPRE
jgi:putative transposase